MRKLINDYPKSDVKLENGSVIKWSTLETGRVIRNNKTMIPVICGGCGKERFLALSFVNQDMSGLCRQCAPGGAHWSLLQRSPKEDQNLETGSVIRWSQTEYKRSKGGGNRLIVPVTCGVCQKTFEVEAGYILESLKTRYTGCHVQCWRKSDVHIRNRNKNYTTRDGYITKHMLLFSDKELFILYPMFDKGGYIAEHRAVLALKLGRPLARNEIVHHLDGNRANNKVSNLRLMKSSKHHRGHGDDYYQKYQEMISLNLILVSLLR